MAISEGYKANFETLKQAVKHGEVCLLECMNKETGKPLDIQIGGDWCGEIRVEE
jgi:hypothetical protein